MFVGAGLHAVSIAHISEHIYLIQTRFNPKDNILWTLQLSPRQIHRNLLFQNAFWFLFNSIVLVTLLLLSITYPHLEVPKFWPFHKNTFTLESNKICQHLAIVVPLILFLGLLSLAFPYIHAIRNPPSNTPETLEEQNAILAGWLHHKQCPACQENGVWHKYVYNEKMQDGIYGKLNQTIAPIVNVWRHFVDKNTS